MTQGARDSGPCFLLLGMHRSGTSLLSGLLGGIGLRQGRAGPEPHLPDSGADRVARALADFGTARLEVLGRHWSDPKPLPEGWADDAGTAQAVTLIEDLYGGPGGALITDPNLSRLVPLWRAALDQSNTPTACLILCRHPLEVAASLYERDGMIETHALELWLTHLLEAEAGSRGAPRALVHYDALMEDWRATLDAAFAALDLPMPRGDPPDELMPRLHLRHHKKTAEDLGEADPRVRDAWAQLAETDWDQRTAYFDRIAAAHRAHWHKVSPGAGASDLPDSLPAALLETADAAIARGDALAAMEALQTAVEKGPHMATTHHRLGLMYLEQANWRRAIATLGRAVELDPSIATYHRKYIEALQRAGRFDDAMKAAELALTIHPEDAELSYRIGQMLLRHGRAEDAEGPLRKAIAASGGDAAQFQALAKALRSQGRADEAEDALREALAGHTDSAALRAEYAALLASRFRYDAALEQAEAALRVAPQDQMALRILISSLTGLGRHGEALEVTRKALAVAPDNPFFHDRFAYLCAVQGDSAGAAAAIEGQFVRDARRCGLRMADDGALQAADPRPPRDIDAATFLRLIRERAARHWAARLRDLGEATPPAGGADWPEGPVLPATPAASSPPGPEDRRLSVMLPVHDPRPDWFAAALDSVLEHAPEDAEIVVLDDGSPSNVAKDVATRRGPRVAYRRNGVRLGRAGNHRACFDQARGALVHILHQHDRVLPGFYDALLPPLGEDDSLVGAASALWRIDDSGARAVAPEAEQPNRGPIDLAPRLRVNQRLRFAGLITRRAAYYASGGFADGLRHGFELELWERLCALGPLWHEPARLAEARLHGPPGAGDPERYEKTIDAMRVVAMIAARRRDMNPLPALSRVFRQALRDLTRLPPETRQRIAALALDGWGEAERAWAEAVIEAITPTD